jgi:hypothetical protein
MPVDQDSYETLATRDALFGVEEMCPDALGELRQEVAKGLLYTHSRANANTSRILEAASFLYALIELLDQKGVLRIAELDARQPAVFKRLEKRYLDKGMGVSLQDPERDKYAVACDGEIDCAARVELCGATCCRLWFPLSHQDIDEGVVQWDLEFPYIIAQDGEGFCKHLHRGNGRCSVYQQRPLPCRAFDCRTDARIWLDFANRVINPNLEAIFQALPPRSG